MHRHHIFAQIYISVKRYLCLYISIYIPYIYLYTRYTHTQAYIYTRLYTPMYIYIWHVYVNNRPTYVYLVYRYIRVYVCHVSIYRCMYSICIYIYTCIFVYIYLYRWLVSLRCFVYTLLPSSNRNTISQLMESAADAKLCFRIRELKWCGPGFVLQSLPSTLSRSVCLSVCLFFPPSSRRQKTTDFFWQRYHVCSVK